MLDLLALDLGSLNERKRVNFDRQTIDAHIPNKIFMFGASITKSYKILFINNVNNNNNFMNS